jgi:hypothetical protein
VVIDLYIRGVHIGSVVRSTGTVYAYAPDGAPLGQLADLDAAVAMLNARRCAA